MFPGRAGLSPCLAPAVAGPVRGARVGILDCVGRAGERRGSLPRRTSPESGAFTVVLQPGWNMAAWLGPEAPVSELFDAIPQLERAYAWNNEEERYRRAFPNTVTLDALRRVDLGMGLWLRVGGDSPVEWTGTLPEVACWSRCPRAGTSSAGVDATARRSRSRSNASATP